MGQEGKYNVQCISCGDVYNAIPGSQLEARCKDREAKGYLDALAINYEECGCDAEYASHDHWGLETMDEWS